MIQTINNIITLVGLLAAVLSLYNHFKINKIITNLKMKHTTKQDYKTMDHIKICNLDRY